MRVQLGALRLAPALLAFSLVYRSARAKRIYALVSPSSLLSSAKVRVRR